MKFRLAEINDLPQLKEVFTEVTKNMTKTCGEIWNDYYPCELFEGDIERKELYILEDKETIVSAIVLCKNNPAEEFIEWQDKNAEVLYVERFGVNVNYQRRGIAGKTLRFALDMAREEKAEYLRLFVVDRNFPAIALYEKFGIERKQGVFYEDIDDGIVYTEYGYEIKTEE